MRSPYGRPRRSSSHPGVESATPLPERCLEAGGAASRLGVAAPFEADDAPGPEGPGVELLVLDAELAVAQGGAELDVGDDDVAVALEPQEVVPGAG